MQITSKITPCLWFDNQGEEAAKFYTGIFRDSKILGTTRYGEAGKEMHRQKPGTAMTVAFELEGQAFTALNGGPMYKFTEAISLQVICDTQEEVDHYWSQLSAGGDEKAQQCGWLKDRYGVSWQVVPRVLPEMITSSSGNAGRMMGAMMKMKKLDIAELERAFQTR
jgi:predicted 3-demethylubiquinone-9 3-methyltransferase (glyoxalase superfamily)